jgi:hypothetical protein
MTEQMILKIQNFKGFFSELKTYAAEPAITVWVMIVGKANPYIKDKEE